VLPLPDELLMKHATLYEDYKNTTHWPKHVLVHYRFHDEGDVDFNKGLYVLLATGAHPRTWCWCCCSCLYMHRLFCCG
jgi:hypothetical protein